MKIDKAREILGDEYDESSDTQLAEEIKTAHLLKDIFFDLLKKGKIPSSEHGKKKR